jgi:hypothetical protein
MALTNDQLRAVFADVMRHWSDLREHTAISKGDLRDGIQAFDAALDANTATINSWFPLPARDELTNRQKLEILLRLLEARRDG